MTDVKNEIGKSLARGSRQIGVMAYWTGLAEAKIARPLWRQGLEIAGVADAVGKDPKPDAMLSQAVTVAQRRQGRGGQRVRIELVSKGQEAVYRVMVPRELPDGRAQTIEEAAISVDCYAPNPQLTVTVIDGSPPSEVRDQVIESVVEWFAEIQGNVLSSEISDGLVGIMGYLTGITLRTGLYFVPWAHADKLRAVQKFVESSTGARFTLWNINGDDENAIEARRDARETFLGRLDSLVGRVREFTERVQPEEALTRSVNAKVREFRVLDAEVELWADILGDYAGQLRSSIEEAKQNLLAAYLGTQDDSTDSTETGVEDAA